MSRKKEPIQWTPTAEGFRGVGNRQGEAYGLIRKPHGKFVLLGVGSYKRSITSMKRLIAIAEATRR